MSNQLAIEIRIIIAEKIFLNQILLFLSFSMQPQTFQTILRQCISIGFIH